MSGISAIIPDNHRLFGVYIYYRLGMAMLLNVLYLSGLAENILGTHQSQLFFYCGLIYVGLCFLSLTFYLLEKIDTQSNHLLLLLIIDFSCLVLMIYSSNTSSIGLGYLLLIPMAIGGTFLRLRASTGLAAFASILVLTSSIVHSLNTFSSTSLLFTSGVTGVLLFVTALAFHILSQRIKSGETQIQKQIEHSNYLHKVSQRIIETIHAGIIVIDNDFKIQLINKAAKELLSHKQAFTEVSQIKELHALLLEWQTNHLLPKATTLNLGVNHDIKISFTNLSDQNQTSIMLYIEDERHINQEAQQLKLASLGRLTASIAHEIRNPLGAISHASQLLDESDHIHAADQELLKMIQINSNRIDQTIDTILHFSRRKSASPENINLCVWLDKFKENYSIAQDVNIVIQLNKDNIYCRIDPNHLQQITTNLVDNAIKHGCKHGQVNAVTIKADIDPSSLQPFVDIIDEGDGIDDSNVDKIFEPFYTTKKSGAGLGLYLCKELCHANQTDIVYYSKSATQKSCFRLLLGYVPATN